MVPQSSRDKPGLLYWIHQRCHYVLEVATAIFFIRPGAGQESHDYGFLWLLAPLFVTVGLCFAAAMHFYLIKEYWFHNATSASSVGLITEAILYISAAITYPLTLSYLHRHRFRVHLVQGASALPCAPRERDFDPAWLLKVEKKGSTLESDEESATPAILEEDEVMSAGDEEMFDPVTAAVQRRNHVQAAGERQPLLAGPRHDLSPRYGTEGLPQRPITIPDSPVGFRSPLTSTSSAGESSVDIGPIRTPQGPDNTKTLFPVGLGLEYSMMWTLAALAIGYAFASSMFVMDLADQRIFDESKIRLFLKNETVTRAGVGFYWMYVFFVYYGLYAAVTSCAIIHSLSLVERRAIIAVFRHPADKEITRRCEKDRRQPNGVSRENERRGGTLVSCPSISVLPASPDGCLL